MVSFNFNEVNYCHGICELTLIQRINNPLKQSLFAACITLHCRDVSRLSCLLFSQL